MVRILLNINLVQNNEEVRDAVVNDVETPKGNKSNNQKQGVEGGLTGRLQRVVTCFGRWGIKKKG